MWLLLIIFILVMALPSLDTIISLQLKHHAEDIDATVKIHMNEFLKYSLIRISILNGGKAKINVKKQTKEKLDLVLTAYLNITQAKLSEYKEEIPNFEHSLSQNTINLADIIIKEYSDSTGEDFRRGFEITKIF